MMENPCKEGRKGQVNKEGTGRCSQKPVTRTNKTINLPVKRYVESVKFLKSLPSDNKFVLAWNVFSYKEKKAS